MNNDKYTNTVVGEGKQKWKLYRKLSDSKKVNTREESKQEKEGVVYSSHILRVLYI